MAYLMQVQLELQLIVRLAHETENNSRKSNQGCGKILHCSAPHHVLTNPQLDILPGIPSLGDSHLHELSHAGLIHHSKWIVGNNLIFLIIRQKRA